MTSGTRVTLFVKPLSGKTELLPEPDGTLVMRVAAPPEKGKANREIVRWMAKKLGKPSSHVRIIAGSHSNQKVIEIYGIDEAELRRSLGICVKQ